ncbi:MAG: cobalt ECF transporter T component CbiQ [Alphaproteobacteria bacterium]|jgi:cobalt/nickel transport system permease protein|nr:cobalt ECF transporter T component CbiQ [Alphaproteobacteria bacterium]
MLPDAQAYAGRLARTPPALKVAVAGSGLLLALSLPPWPWDLAVLLAALAAAFLWARLPARLFLGWLALAFGFLAASALALALSISPDFPWLALSSESVLQAGQVSLRAMAASSWMIWLALTTPAQHLAWLIKRLPGLEILSEMMLLIHRQLVLLMQTAQDMRRAQAARLGYRDVGHSLKSLGTLSAALLPRALARAERMEFGLAARNLDAATLPFQEPPRAAPLVLLLIACVDGVFLIWALS